MSKWTLMTSAALFALAGCAGAGGFQDAVGEQPEIEAAGGGASSTTRAASEAQAAQTPPLEGMQDQRTRPQAASGLTRAEVQAETEATIDASANAVFPNRSRDEWLIR